MSEVSNHIRQEVLIYAHRLYETGYSITSLARELGVTAEQLRQAFVEKGWEVFRGD